jgi:hypothetical protein
MCVAGLLDHFIICWWPLSFCSLVSHRAGKGSKLFVSFFSCCRGPERDGSIRTISKRLMTLLRILLYEFQSSFMSIQYITGIDTGMIFRAVLTSTWSRSAGGRSSDQHRWAPTLKEFCRDVRHPTLGVLVRYRSKLFRTKRLLFRYRSSFEIGFQNFSLKYVRVHIPVYVRVYWCCSCSCSYLCPLSCSFLRSLHVMFMFMLHGHEKGHAKLPMSMSAFIFIFIFMLHEHENDHGQRHGYGHRSENQRFWCRISNSGKILIRYLI